MNSQRLSQQLFNEANGDLAAVKPAFFLMSVPVNELQTGTMQWLYQQLYAQALEANRPKRTTDLFAVMN